MSQNLLLDMVLSLDGMRDLVKQDYVYIHPDIPIKKLNNAISSYANSDIKPEDVMILLDDSVFGGAKDGVLLTKDFLFAKSSSNKPVFFKIDNIKTIDSSGLVYSTLNINGNKVFSFNQIGKIAFKEFCKVVEIYIEKSKNIEDEKTDHIQTIDSHSSQELNHIQNSDTQHLTKESNHDDLLLKMVLALDGTHSLVTQDKLYVHPNIPAKKIRNALESYVHNTKPEDIMVLVDDTLFGSGSDGVALTKKGLFIKPNNSRNKYFFDMDCIKTIAADGMVLINLVINGSEKLPDFNQIGKSTLKAFCEFVTLYLIELRQVKSNTVNIKTNQQIETKQTSSFNESIVSDLNKKNIEPEKKFKTEKELHESVRKEKGLQEVVLEAEQGSPVAQFYLSIMYRHEGLSDNQNPEPKTIYWLKKAVAQNYPKAISNLASLHEYGLCGVTKNFAKALELYQQAATLEDPSAQSKLGELYLYGTGGMAQNDEKAIEYFKKACENFSKPSRLNNDVITGGKYERVNEKLGNIYQNLGAYDQAIEWYEKDLYSYSSAEKVGNLYFELGNYEKAFEYFTQPKIKQDSKYVVSNGMFSTSGKLHLGIMYYDGKGVVKDHTLAFEYLKKAIDSFLRLYSDENTLSDLDREECIYNKEYFKNAAEYLDLITDEEDEDEDEDDVNESNDIISRLNNYYLLAVDGDNEAFKQLEKMAKFGHYFAQYKLGIMYARGEFVERDPEEASKWIEKSASKGYPDAQFWIGLVLREWEKDDEEAIEWFLLAAKQGHMGAQFTLGGMYMNGRGVEKDIDEAFYWFNKAAKQGHESAIDIVKELSERYL